MLKRLLITFFLIANLLTAATAGKISKIVFFGDSLTDNGKLYQLLLHVLPKSPPYWNGRFSNGPTWAEDLAKYYYDKYYLPSENFALGGATTVFHMPSSKFMSTSTLEIEISAFLIENLFKNKSNVLFVIWIGANDYLYLPPDTDIDKMSTSVINKIDWAMRTLKYYGANYFLILNLPDLSHIPFARENDNEAMLKAASILHNTKLQQSLAKFNSDYPNSTIFTIDAFNLLDNLIEDPGAFNKKYNINITETKEACWTGGFIASANKKILMQELESAYMKQHDDLPNDFDVEGASNYILHNPELAYTYTLGRSLAAGNVPCNNPNEHVYWDSMHPSQTVHQVLALIAEDTLGNAI